MLMRCDYLIADECAASEADTGTSLSNDVENELPKQVKK